MGPMIGHQAEYLFNDIIAVSVLGVVRGRLGSFEQFVSNIQFKKRFGYLLSHGVIALIITFLCASSGRWEPLFSHHSNLEPNIFCIHIKLLKYIFTFLGSKCFFLSMHLKKLLSIKSPLHICADNKTHTKSLTFQYVLFLRFLQFGKVTQFFAILYKVQMQPTIRLLSSLIAHARIKISVQ